MRKYQVSYYGLSGFATRSFDTKKEAMNYVDEEVKKGFMTPLKLYKYDEESDTYKVIGTFSVVYSDK